MIINSKLTCPKCGASSPMKSFVNGDLNEIIALAAKFGIRWPWVAEYLHGFQTDHDKPLRPAKLKLLILEIQEMIDRHGFTFEKKPHSVRPESIYQGLRVVSLKNLTGLKSHSYLYKVVLSINEQLIKQDESEQRKRENEAFQRSQRDSKTPERIKDILEKIK